MGSVCTVLGVRYAIIYYSFFCDRHQDFNVKNRPSQMTYTKRPIKNTSEIRADHMYLEPRGKRSEEGQWGLLVIVRRSAGLK